MVLLPLSLPSQYKLCQHIHKYKVCICVHVFVFMHTVCMEVLMRNLFIAPEIKGWHNWSKICLLNYIFKVHISFILGAIM